jgi:hypothetical protein
MTACRPEELEGLVRGELLPAVDAEQRAHLPTCASCRAELAALESERAIFAARRAQEPALPDLLWQGVEARLFRAPGGAPRPVRYIRTGVWVSCGAIALAAAAAFLWAPRPPSRPPGALEARERSPADEARDPDRTVAAAEKQYREAIAGLEAEYRTRRGRLDPAVAELYDATFARTRSDLTATAPGEPLELRLRALDGYAVYLRSLQTVVNEIPEETP